MIGNKKIAVILIATGDYTVYCQNIIKDIIQNNNKQNSYTFCIFTDQKIKFSKDLKSEILLIKWDHKPWPYVTLFRYQAISLLKNYVTNIDYLIYLDVDMRVNCDLDIFTESDLFAVKHPGFSYKRKSKYPLEKRIESEAFIKPSSANYYLCGGVQGGRFEKYLEVSGFIEARIEKDFNQNLVAIWHDESHWNRYVNENLNEFAVLNRDYCWPQEWVSLAYPGKIIALQKAPSELKANNYTEFFIFYVKNFYLKFRLAVRPYRY